MNKKIHVEQGLCILLIGLDCNQINACESNSDVENSKINIEIDQNKSLANFLNKKRRHQNDDGQNNLKNEQQLNLEFNENKNVQNSNLLNAPKKELKQPNLVKISPLFNKADQNDDGQNNLKNEQQLNLEFNENKNVQNSNLLNAPKKELKQPNLVKISPLFNKADQNDDGQNNLKNDDDQINLNNDWVYENNLDIMNWRIYDILNICKVCLPYFNKDLVPPMDDSKSGYESLECENCLSEQEKQIKNKIKYKSNTIINEPNVFISEKLNKTINDNFDKNENFRKCFIKKLEQIYKIQNKKLHNKDIDKALEVYDLVKFTMDEVFLNMIDANSLRMRSAIDNIIDNFKKHKNINENIDDFFTNVYEIKYFYSNKSNPNYAEYDKMLINLIKNFIKLKFYGEKIENAQCENDCVNNYISDIDNILEAFEYLNNFLYVFLFKYQHVAKYYVSGNESAWDDFIHGRCHSYFSLFKGLLPNELKIIGAITSFYKGYKDALKNLKNTLFNQEFFKKLIDKSGNDRVLLSKINKLNFLFQKINDVDLQQVYMEFFGISERDYFHKKEINDLLSKFKGYIYALEKLYQKDCDKNIENIKKINKDFKINLEKELSDYKSSYCSFYNNLDFNKFFTKNDLTKEDVEKFKKYFTDNLQKIKQRVLKNNTNRIITLGAFNENDKGKFTNLNQVKNIAHECDSMDNASMKNIVGMYYFLNQVKNLTLHFKNKKNKSNLDMDMFNFLRNKYIDLIEYMFFHIGQHNLLEFDFFSDVNLNNTGRLGLRAQYNQHLEFFTSEELKKRNITIDYVFIYLDKIMLDLLDFIKNYFN